MSYLNERKKPRHRSPAYPSIDLRSAIEKAETIYKSEKRHAAPVAVIAQHCGYDITSSGGLRAIAALKQFGLLLEEGSNEERQLRLSELALDILIADSDESPARLKAIERAALSPAIHKKIWEKYGGTLPSKQTLRAYLVRDMEFNDAHVDRFIRQLTQTVSFARLDEPDTIEDDEDDGESSSSSNSLATVDPHWEIQPYPRIAPAHYPMTPLSPALPAPQGYVRLPLPFPSLKVGWIEVPSQLTEVEFTTMISTLTMFKDALVNPSQPPLGGELPPNHQ